MMTTTFASHYPVLDRRRVFLVRRLVALVALTSVLLGGFVTFSGVVGADGPVASEPYVVRSGDTLWELASLRTESGRDVRAAMADIMALNELETSALTVGQVLELPVGP